MTSGGYAGAEGWGWQRVASNERPEVSEVVEGNHLSNPEEFVGLFSQNPEICGRIYRTPLELPLLW